MRPMEQWKIVHKSVLVTLAIYSGDTPSNAAKRAASACNSASLAAITSSCASRYVTLRQADCVKETYLCCRHCCQCLLQLGLLGGYDFILREWVYWLRCDKLMVRKKHTFAAIAVDACSTSASLAAKASSCASWCVSPVATGQTRYK